MNTFHLRITGDLGFEFWQDIPGYEGLYQASTYGRIIRYKKPAPLNTFRTGRGYPSVRLSNRLGKTFYVHKLVALTFIPNPENLPQINHRDENKENNRVENLEWCTASYNNNFGTHNSRMAASKSKTVLQFDMQGNLVKRYASARNAERETGFDQSNISKCCRNEFKQAYGFIWKYSEI